VEEVDDEVGVRVVGERVIDLSDRDDLLEGVGVELNDQQYIIERKKVERYVWETDAKDNIEIGSDRKALECELRVRM